MIEELGEAPAALAIPVGNAGNVTAWNRGFSEREATPILYGFQAEGAAPLVHGHPVENPETVASAIRIGNPARWEEAMAAITSSRGRIAAVSDEQILDAYRLLASREGVFCEPASAASVAGILAHGLPAVEGDAPPESVVCVLTGHGLKDPDTALGKAPSVTRCENDLAAGRARGLRPSRRRLYAVPLSQEGDRTKPAGGSDTKRNSRCPSVANSPHRPIVPAYGAFDARKNRCQSDIVE